MTAPLPKRMRRGAAACGPLGTVAAGLRSPTSSILTTDRIARVMFVLHDGQMVLLHGFIKKTQKTLQADLELARKRMKEVKR